MAYVNNTRAGSAVLSEGFGGILRSLRQAMERRATFARTIRELNALTDRELADLGIARASIPEIAREAAYGN